MIGKLMSRGDRHVSYSLEFFSHSGGIKLPLNILSISSGK